jgi:hypothetical protein
MDLAALLKELPEIAARADRERLSVLWPEFEDAYPDLAAEIKYCAAIEDSQTVLRYLNERISILKLLRMTTPKFDETLIFIHQFLREKLHGEIQPKLVGSSSTADALRSDRRSTDSPDGHPTRRSARKRKPNS